MQIAVTYRVVPGPNADASSARAAPSSRGGRPAAATQYVVQPGDSLSGIAAQFGIDESSLAGWNGIADANMIVIGQALRLTAAVAPAAPTPPASGRTYVVQPGDTVYGIASQFGVNADRLVAVNALADPSDIQIGQTLALPTAGSSG